MINTIASVQSQDSVYTAKKTAAAKESANIAADLSKPVASSVVELNGTQASKSTATATPVDGKSAAALALDIASLLGAHGGKVQEHLNGFDAARLLAD
ncbi:MAG: hypothetical protein SPL30_03050 [Succinivibrio sp.]|nr:hypothetical protein [Succinivibrio sp.]